MVDVTVCNITATRSPADGRPSTCAPARLAHLRASIACGETQSESLTEDRPERVLAWCGDDPAMISHEVLGADVTDSNVGD